MIAAHPNHRDDLLQPVAGHQQQGPYIGAEASLVIGLPRLETSPPTQTCPPGSWTARAPIRCLGSKAADRAVQAR
ncbi:hypothetical protein D9R06_09490 [Kocuria marina subsp. indica]|nr:hypothetical protein D9R06_09490 [Kocuria indica]